MGNFKHVNKWMFCQIFHPQICDLDTFEADNNGNNIEIFRVINLFNNKWFSRSILRTSKIVSTSKIKGYFGWGVLLLNTPNVRVDILGWLPIRIFPTGSWRADIADLWFPMILYFNPFSNKSVKKSSVSFMSYLVGYISYSEHQIHHFFQAEL